MNKQAVDKTWNRVLQPPGGRSSIQLGWEESFDQVTVAKNQPTEHESSEENICGITSNQVPSNCRNLGLPISCNKFASGSNMNSGNVITDRPSSRVTQPPGGKSSIHFG